MRTEKKQVAFTLAEVLITLGIIGIIAAMTLPTLLSNYRKQVAETRVAKFYSTMNQAIQRAENDYGDKKIGVKLVMVLLLMKMVMSIKQSRCLKLGLISI